MTGDLFGEVLPADVGATGLTQWLPADWIVQPDWQPTLDAFWRSAQGISLAAFVQSRIDAGAVIYPGSVSWPSSGAGLVILRGARRENSPVVA
jgi:uracil-DNA glycosylase